MRKQFLAGARLAEQQHRRIDLRGAARLTLGFEARGARADEARERVFRAARLRERTLRRDQLLLKLGVAGKDRRKRLQLVEQRKADRADRLAGLVLQRQARDDERLAARLHDVEQDRLPGRHDLAHQAVRDHGLAVEADGLLRIGETEARRVPLVHPHDARIAIDDHRARARILEGPEQRLGGAPQHVAVVDGQAPSHSSSCRRLRVFWAGCLRIETDYLTLETRRNALSGKALPDSAGWPNGHFVSGWRRFM